MSEYLSENNPIIEEEDVQPSTSQPYFTQEQIDRAERNRKRALEIRKDKEETAAKMYLKWEGNQFIKN
jgi:hypothetical protein